MGLTAVSRRLPRAHLGMLGVISAGQRTEIGTIDGVSFEILEGIQAPTITGREPDHGSGPSDFLLRLKSQGS